MLDFFEIDIVGGLACILISVLATFIPVKHNSPWIGRLLIIGGSFLFLEVAQEYLSVVIEQDLIIITFFGFVSAQVTESLIDYLNRRQHSSSNKEHRNGSNKKKDKILNSIHNHHLGHSAGHIDEQNDTRVEEKLAYTNLILDGLHNAHDGILLAGGISSHASFATNLAVMISIILHELPGELADAALFRQAGWRNRKIFLLNGLAATSVLIPSFLLRLGYNMSWLNDLRTGAFLSGLLLHMAILQLYVHGQELLHSYHQTHREGSQFMVVVTRSPILRLIRQEADKVVSSVFGVIVFLILHSMNGHVHSHHDAHGHLHGHSHQH